MRDVNDRSKWYSRSIVYIGEIFERTEKESRKTNDSNKKGILKTKAESNKRQQGVEEQTKRNYPPPTKPRKP